MNKFERLKTELEQNKTGKMKAFGNSMLPILKSGSLLTFITKENYEKGDIVFCKVKGRYIDAHIVTKIDKIKGYLISNNHGFDNGWTKIIYGAVCIAEYQNKIIFTTQIKNETD
jgi:phage repressor protein C with HTH and peptisase S24 domain